MSKIRFKLNRKGVGELLKSAQMQRVLQDYASRVQGQMGEEFETYIAGTRAVVGSRSRKGDKQAMKGNKLLKVLGGSRRQ